MEDHTYGRGKFVAHPEYIKYMQDIVKHPTYASMPNAVSPEGRVKWQVSSGKTTSFYEDYLARRDWWIQKADELGLPGTADEGDRFTVAARLIHPTGYRVCRLCGQRSNVGYFYLNALFAARLTATFVSGSFDRGDSITNLLEYFVTQKCPRAVVMMHLNALFPERAQAFAKFGPTVQAFEHSNSIRSRWLSPGFMGNPPDRLDGFHDYDLSCRKANDPGRSDDNMRTYNHDRRSFEWWAEGNWALADALFNSAGKGHCSVDGCEEPLERVSPDHVGPLACGFKQLPFFEPLCQKHNSAKNRRFSMSDVGLLLAYEQRSGQSVASWQVRAHWDKYKTQVKDDRQTKALSNSLRSLQDFYLRTLWAVKKAGRVRLLASLLHPEYAMQDFEFVGLDSATLRFEKVLARQNDSMMRKRLAARTVRIAFEALFEYVSKSEVKRKMVRSDFEVNETAVNALVSVLAASLDEEDMQWQQALHGSNHEVEGSITSLLAGGAVKERPTDLYGRSLLQKLFDDVGAAADIDFSRYEDVL